MVVSVLIITCFLKLAACNPYLSSNAKFPSVASFATNPSEGNIKQVPNLQQNNGYTYSIPQQRTQKVEPSNTNKPASMHIPIKPEQNLSDIQNNYNNIDGPSPISEFKTNTDQGPNLVPKKNTNDTPSSIGQRKSFSKTFNDFRENVVKNMNLGLKSKSPSTNGLDNVKADSIYQMPTAIETKIPPPQFLQQKNNLGQQVAARNNEDFKPIDAVKDHTTDVENILVNGMQVSRLPYNNGNPIILMSKEDSFGKLNSNVQQQDITNNSADVFKDDKMQASRVPVPKNLNLQPPYKEENNIPQVLRPNQLNSPNFFSLNYQSMLDSNQTIKDNQVTSNANSLPQLQISRTPYYNNFNQPYASVVGQLVTPGNSALPENKLQKVDLTYNVVPQIPNIFSDAQEFPLGAYSPEVQPVSTKQKLHNKEKNVTQTFRAPNYNNSNRQYTRPLSDQLAKEIQSDKPDSNYNDLERNNLKEISSEGIIPETIIQSQSLLTKEGSVYQKFGTPHNDRFNQPYTGPFNQKILFENQLLRENQKEMFDPIYNERNIDQNQKNKLQYIPSDLAFPESIIQSAQNLLNIEENASQTFRLPYYNNYNWPYTRPENQSEKADPNHNAVESNNELPMHHIQQKATSNVVSPEALIQPVKSPQNKQGNTPQTYLPPYYNNFNRSYAKPLNQQIITGNQLVIEHPSRILDPNYNEVISKDSLQETISKVAGPETVYAQSLGNEINVSKSIGVPFYNNFFANQPFSTAFTQQLEPRDQFKENQLVRADPNNDVNRNAKQIQPLISMPATIHNDNQSDTISTELLDQPSKTLNVSKSQMSRVPTNVSLIDQGDLIIPNYHMFEENELVNTDLISRPELDLSINLPNKDFLYTMPQMSVLLVQENLSQVSAVENEVINGSRILNESHNNNFDLLSSMAITTQLLHGNQLSKEYDRPEPLISPETNMEYSKTMTINTGTNSTITDKSISQIQAPVELSFCQPQNTSQTANPAIVIYQPKSTIGKEEPELNNYIFNNVQDATTEQLIELPSQPQENLPEYVNSVDNSENMRTKNEIPTAAYYPEYRIKSTKTSVNDNIFGNERKTSTIPYYNIFNPFNSRASSQKFTSHNQNSSLKNKNTFDTSTDKMPNRNEPHMPQDTPQPNNKNLLTIDTPNSSLDVIIINSEAEKSLGSPEFKNTNSSSTYNGSVPEREFQISNQFTHQANETVKTNPSDSHYLKNEYLPSVQDLKQINESESQINRIRAYGGANSFNCDALNQQTPLSDQNLNDDLSNKITIINQNASPKLDININLPNTESSDNSIPIEITITEILEEACVHTIPIANSTSPNTQIETYNENENIYCLTKCQVNATNVDVLIPCLIDKANATRINNCTNIADKSSNFIEIMPNVNFEHFSSYLADAILSAVQLFLIQPTNSSTNNCVTENCGFDNVDQYNFSCNCSKISNLKDPTILLQKCEKGMRPGKLESDDDEENDAPIVTDKKNTTTNENWPILNTNAASDFSSNHSNKTVTVQSTKDSCVCLNGITPIPPKIDDMSYIKKSNIDDKLQTANRSYESGNLLNNTNQVLKTKDEKTSNTNYTVDNSLNQTPKILLPFYYYSDTISNETNQPNEPKLVSQPVITAEDENNVVMSLEDDGPTTETTTENNLEVKRTCGPKPCLSKITVNILPIVENKNNHDIVVFL